MTDTECDSTWMVMLYDPANSQDGCTFSKSFGSLWMAQSFADNARNQGYRYTLANVVSI